MHEYTFLMYFQLENIETEYWLYFDNTVHVTPTTLPYYMSKGDAAH